MKDKSFNLQLKETKNQFKIIYLEVGNKICIKNSLKVGKCLAKTKKKQRLYRCGKNSNNFH